MSADLAVRLESCEAVIERGIDEDSTRAEQLAYHEARIERALAARQREPRPGIKRSDSRRHVVYIFRDASGAALYVGVSLTATQRLGAHSQNGWFADVARIDLEHFSDRASALQREAELIVALLPRHNKAGVPK